MIRKKGPRAFGAGSFPPFGFSTIEILIAFAVGIIFLSAAMMVAFSDPTFTKQVSLDNGQAAALDTMLDNGGLYRAVNNIGSTTKRLFENWNAVFAVATNAGYTSTSSVSDISPCMKQVMSDTGWSSLNSRTHDISFGTMLGNIDIARAFGPGGCDPTPPNEWDSPKKYTNGVSISSVNANDVLVTTDNGKRIVVIASTPQGNGAGPIALDDLYTYDLTDPANPSAVLGEINTGKGINAITAHGAYVYAVQNDSTNQLQVIRIFDKTKAPTDPLYYKMATTSQISLHNVSGAFPEGRSIVYYNGYIYIGTWNNNVPLISPEFLVYDVSSSTNPVFRGELNMNTSVNSIAIQGTHAYLATTDNVGELTVVNIATATNPTIAGRYNLPLSVNDAEEVFVLGSKAYLGLNRQTSNLGEFLIINISTPTSPYLFATTSLNLKNNTKVTGIDVRGRYAFIGTDVSNEEFRVLDVSNPQNISVMPCSPYNYSAKVSALEYSGGYIFLVGQANDALRIIYDTSGPMCN